MVYQEYHQMTKILGLPYELSCDKNSKMGCFGTG